VAQSVMRKPPAVGVSATPPYRTRLLLFNSPVNNPG